MSKVCVHNAFLKKSKALVSYEFVVQCTVVKDVIQSIEEGVVTANKSNEMAIELVVSLISGKVANKQWIFG